MDNPTHADAFLNLLSSCFPTCRSSSNHGPALPPSPQLGALLRDPESDDAMSLHSTYRPHTRPKKKKAGMELCGLNLFGKSRGQIRLEDDDTEPPLPRPRPRYDSDAAPIPDSTIESLSTPTTEQPTRQETLESELARLRAEKAARKARKRERKLKRQLALEHTPEFEGFIGSGSLPISPPSTTTSTPGIEDTMSDRASARLVDVDVDMGADPEDGDADMGAAVYTCSVRSRSESGSSATRSSRAREEGLAPGNVLGLRGPPSPLVQEYIPETPELALDSQPKPVESKSKSRSEAVESKSKSDPEPESKAPTQPKPKPRIHISNLPLSSPGAGPGPRTLENSPRLAALETGTTTPRQSESYFSPKLDANSPTLTIPRPILLSPTGFPSSGLSRPSKGLGVPSGLGKSKSVGSGPGLGLNCTSPRSGREFSFGGDGSQSGNGRADGNRDGNGNGSQFVGDRSGGSGDAGSQRSSGDSDGSRSAWYGQGSTGGGSEWKGRVTPQMGVALANRGGE